jgi:hypothetical protein
MCLLLDAVVFIDCLNFLILRVLQKTSFCNLHSLIMEFQRRHLQAEVLPAAEKRSNIGAAIKASPSLEEWNHVLIKVTHKGRLCTRKGQERRDTIECS